MKKCFFYLIELFRRKDEKIPKDLELSNDIREYKYFHKITNSYRNRIIKKRIIRLFKYHKFAILRTIMMLIIVSTAGYFIITNFYPKLIFLKSDRFSAKIEKDSTVIIDHVINPILIKYLTYISATEVNLKDSIKAYQTICNDKNSSAIGKYQMTKSARSAVGLGNVPDDVFLNWPELQDIACYKLLHLNYNQMKGFIKEYDGQIINGYYLTESGMLSLSHALGGSGAIDWIKTGCKRELLPAGAPKADERLTLQKFKIKFD